MKGVDDECRSAGPGSVRRSYTTKEQLGLVHEELDSLETAITQRLRTAAGIVGLEIELAEPTHGARLADGPGELTELAEVAMRRIQGLRNLVYTVAGRLDELGLNEKARLAPSCG